MVNLQFQLLKVTFHVVWIVQNLSRGQTVTQKWQILTFVRKANWFKLININYWNMAPKLAHWIEMNITGTLRRYLKINCLNIIFLKPNLGKITRVFIAWLIAWLTDWALFACVNSELDGDVKTGTISLASNLRLEVSSYIHFTGFALQELLLSGRAKTKIYLKSQPKTGHL